MNTEIYLIADFLSSRTLLVGENKGFLGDLSLITVDFCFTSITNLSELPLALFTITDQALLK